MIPIAFCALFAFVGLVLIVKTIVGDRRALQRDMDRARTDRDDLERMLLALGIMDEEGRLLNEDGTVAKHQPSPGRRTTE